MSKHDTFATSNMGGLNDALFLYELPKSKGWEVVDTSETESEIRINLRTTLKHANISDESLKKWQSETYTLRVSKHNVMVC